MSNVSPRGSRAPFKEMMRLETMLPSWMRRLGYYGLALLLVAIGATVRWALTRWVGPGLPEYITFYPLVMLAALMGGWGPGLLATLATMVVVDYWLLPPPGLFNFESMVDAVGLAFFCAMGIFASIVAELYRRTRDHLEELVIVRTAALSDANEQLQQEITERKRTQAAIQQANEQLQQQAEELQTQSEELQTQAEELQRANEELRQSEQALYEAEERLYLAMESGKVGVWELEPGTDRAEWSQGVYMLFGFKPGEVTPTQEAFRQRIHPEDLARQDQALKDALERCEDYLCEFRVVWADGSVHWVEARGQYVYLKSENGTILRMRGVLSDIDRRKQAEETLRQSEQRLKRAQEIAHLGSWELDVAKNQLVWSEEVYRIFGIKPQQFAATYEAFLEAVHPEDRAAVDTAYAGSLREGRDSYEIEHRVVRKPTGEIRIVHERCEHVRDESGRIVRSVGMVHDITERKRAEESLRELATTLESRVAERTAQLQHRARQLQKLTLELSQTEDRERKRMAEILHDDLQQIIAGAKFHLGLLRNRVKYDASLQAIGAQIDQMLKDAIEKSRGLSHELSPAVLHQGDFTETLDWLANQVRAKHGLVVHVHTQGPVVLRSDALQGFLYKAAQELLFNVVKHARVKEARIRVRRCGRCVCLSVSDRGRGFDPQELRQASGFGLLSIRERIELLGGRMKIKSAKGKGSTFYIVVPDRERVVAPPPPGVTATQPGAAGPHARDRLRVLLADDHRIVREGLRLLLSDEYDIEIVGEAAHGREAVDLALRLEPDVVIMDVSMPLIDGDEATRQIKDHLPKTRVIALSTYNEPETIQKMYRAGAEGYVLKTASSEELLAAIRGPEPDSE